MSVKPTKFPEISSLFPPVAESSRLLVGCRREDYSASRIAHAVEDCNAHLLNLNVTSFGDGFRADDDGEYDTPRFPVVFDIRVNHRNARSVGRSLERYGYTVPDTADANEPDEVTADRIEGLLRYLQP